MVQSKIDKIDQWIKLNCSDTARHNVETKVVNTADQSTSDANIEALVTKFISRDLSIPTPLTWELFRQMISYATNKLYIIKLEKAATIASLCNIATDEFPSVLNFYHEHGAFLCYADVEYLCNIMIQNGCRQQ